MLQAISRIGSRLAWRYLIVTTRRHTDNPIIPAMQINIQTREIELDREEYAHIERQLRFGLTRYQPEVKRVDVVLSQEHSADRGHCQRTRIRIHCRSVDDLEVEDVERSLQDAVFSSG